MTEPSQGYSWKSTAVAAAKRDIPGLPIVMMPGSRIWKTDYEKRNGIDSLLQYGEIRVVPYDG